MLKDDRNPLLSGTVGSRQHPPSGQGRYDLRYQYDHGATEFWGYLNRQPTFDFKKGVVGVVATPDTPATPSS